MTKAEEFAQYLAKSAEEFMDSVNDLLMATDDVNEGELDESHLEAFQQSYTEAWKHLQSAIYEFRKRAEND